MTPKHKYDTILLHTEVCGHGADFKLDVGLYRLDQQVACQRYRQIRIDATSTLRDRLVAVASSVKAAFTVRAFAPAVA